MKGKIKLLIISIMVFLTAITGLVACNNEGTGDGSFTLKLVEPAFRDLMYLKEEYDVAEIIEMEDGVTYSIEELFYLDSEFKKQTLEFDGLKFTQDKPFDVLLTIKGKKGKAEDSETVTIKYNIKSSAIQDDFLMSWNDTGVSKTLTAEESFLPVGTESGVNVSYIGDYNPASDAVNFGGISKSYKNFSVTDWSNAVLTMDFYNPNNHDLSLIVYLNDGVEWRLLMDYAYTLKANDFTSIAFSFARLGYESNFIELLKGSISFKVKIPNSLEMVAPFNYNFTVSNIDVVDYSAERFPDLLTSSNDKIFNETPGDIVDKKMVFYPENSPNYKIELNRDEDFIKEGDTSVKYTFTKNADHASPTINRGNLFYDVKGRLFNDFTITDWSKAFVSFWFKNESGYTLDLSVRFANSQDGKVFRGSDSFIFDSYATKTNVGTSNEWTYIEFPLIETFPNIFDTDVTNIKFSIAIEMVSQENVPVTMYIDDLKFFEAIGDENDIDVYNSLADEEQQRTINTDNTFIKEGFSSLKFDYTKASDNNKKVVFQSNSYLTKVFDDVTDWSNAYVGFWAYNNTGKNITFVLNVRADKHDDTTVGNQYLDFEYKYGKDIPSGGWTFVEFSLKDLYDIEVDITDKDVFKALYIKLHSEIVIETNETVTYYIDDFKFYNQVADETDLSIFNSGEDGNTTARAINYTPEYIKDGNTSLKFTFTRTGELIRSNAFIASNSLNDNIDVSDWENAYVGFWIYNATGKSMDIRLGIYAERLDNSYIGTTLDFLYDKFKMSIANQGWTYVELSLKDLYGIDVDITDREVFKNLFFKLTTEIVAELNESFTYYIDGFKLYTKIIDADDLAVFGTQVDSLSVSRELNTDPNFVKVGSSSVKFTFSKGSATSGRSSAFISVGHLNSLFDVTDWSNAYVGYWVYNPTQTNFDIRLAIQATSIADSTLVGLEVLDFNYDTANQSAAPGWTFVELSLKDIYGINADITDATLYKNQYIKLTTEIIIDANQSASYYIDNLSFYNK